ncbi:hypothetical protein [Planktotalea sp.]|uniref:hypothetical protein n=1 Tax=Planktotalea sp. TaxID=2029877 RepID=UPI0025D9B3DF|nr:hypothetical protein [Planktotalea sp.]
MSAMPEDGKHRLRHIQITLATLTDSLYTRDIDKGAPDAPFFYVEHKDAKRVLDEPLSSSPI